jgi:hypothetical protein
MSLSQLEKMVRLISSNAKSGVDYTTGHSGKMTGRAIASLIRPR